MIYETAYPLKKISETMEQFSHLLFYRSDSCYCCPYCADSYLRPQFFYFINHNDRNFVRRTVNKHM